MNAPTVIEQTIEPMTNKASPPALVAGARPKAIVPVDMDQVWRFATIVAKSGMAPKDMQKAETITVAIMHGLEIGLTPLMALQRIAVINGRPAIWGDGAMSLVRASGLCEYVHEAISGDGDLMLAVCRAKRKGEREPIERTFSVADAKKAGLWGKSGTWQQYPKRMLQMRARAFTLRDLFADVLGGLYVAEELEGEDPPMKDITPREEVRPAEGQAELPPPVKRGPGRPPKVATLPAEEAAAEQANEPTTSRPLPPLAKTKRPEPTADDSGIPPALDRRPKPPTHDQPEDYFKYVASKFSETATIDDLNEAYESLVAIHREEITPQDIQDFNDLFGENQRRIEDAA